MAGAPNVVLVVLDTVRARNLSCYGYERRTTPFLEGFARENVVAERAYAPSEWTPTSHASLFTGSYPWVHQTGRESNRLAPGMTTLAGTLSEVGYETVGFSNNTYVSPTFDFDRGFDTFEFNSAAFGEPFDDGVPVQEIRKHVDGAKRMQVLGALEYVHESDGSLVPTFGNWLYKKAFDLGVVTPSDSGSEQALEFVDRWLQGRKSGQPFFLFLNLMEGHTPYQAPGKHRDRFDPPTDRVGWEDLGGFYSGNVENQDGELMSLLDRYDGSISYLDSVLRRLSTLLAERNAIDDTMVIITGDHGEHFGEHDLYGHVAGLYNELIRVPLLVRTPNGRSDEISEPVSIQWLMPTVLKLAGAQLPEHCVDTSLFADETPPVFAETRPLELEVQIPREVSRLESKARACIQDGCKLVTAVDGTYHELYEIDDLSESDDVSSARSETVEEYREQLSQKVRSSNPVSHEDDIAMDEGTREQLERLGYLE